MGDQGKEIVPDLCGAGLLKEASDCESTENASEDDGAHGGHEVEEGLTPDGPLNLEIRLGVIEMKFPSGPGIPDRGLQAIRAGLPVLNRPQGGRVAQGSEGPLCDRPEMIPQPFLQTIG